MYEYKVVVAPVKEAENEMNKLGKIGWKVVAVSPNIAVGHGVVITFERERDY